MCDQTTLEQAMFNFKKVTLIAEELMQFINKTGAKDIVYLGSRKKEGKLNIEKMPFYETATYEHAVQELSSSRLTWERYEDSKLSKAVDASAGAG